MNRDPQNREGQKNPIFLLQKRDYQLTCCPAWLGYDGDSFWVEIQYIDDIDTSEWNFYDKGEVNEKLLFEYLASYENNDCTTVVESWITESVWLTRYEAEYFGKANEYNYQFGWRVHCLSACGELAEILNKTELLNVTDFVAN
jgi:hypothetical protein